MISRIVTQRAVRQLTLTTTTTATSNVLIGKGVSRSSNSNALSSSVVRRCYVSRAHQSASPEAAYPIADALEEVLMGVSERIEKRAARWEQNKEKRIKGVKIKDEGPYRNQDETIELILNLNLDPRKPGQSLRGSLPLPHGTGKKISVAVFTSDPSTITAVTAAGASLAGGNDLIRSIADGTTPVTFDRALATPDMMPALSRIARVLGPRGLMPNAKVGTIQDEGEDMAVAVKSQVDGMVQYRAEKNGIVHVGVGKAGFGSDHLLDNIRTFLTEIHNVKPESFGKGKKKASSSNKGTKYFLKAHLSSAQGKSVNLDIQTVDPTSNFYMSMVPN